MSVIHDYFCPACGKEIRDVVLEMDDRPDCSCGTEMDVLWDHGQPPATDIYGCEQVSAVLEDKHNRPLTYTSSRERDMKMAEQGFTPCGDRVGGARTVFNSEPKPLTTKEMRAKYVRVGGKPAA